MNLVLKENSANFGKKQCIRCGRNMHQMYPEDLCPACMEIELFHQVKEYIRENDVNEQDVAEHFDISVKKVRDWIREGRIQYKGESADKISSVTCKICGKPISFGVTCPECHSLAQLQVVAQMNQAQDEKMHFIGKNTMKEK